MSMIMYNVEIVIGTDIYPYQKVEADSIKSAYLEAYNSIRTDSKPYDQLEEDRIGIAAFIYSNDPTMNNNCPACDSNDLFVIYEDGIMRCQVCEHPRLIHNFLGTKLSEERQIECPHCEEVFTTNHSIAYCPKCHNRNVACEACLGFVSVGGDNIPKCNLCFDGSQFKEWLTDEERIIRNGQ